MNKKQVQQRVTQNGKKLALSKFKWCEKTNTFSSNENNLVIDFSKINCCTFTTGGGCAFTTGNDCTFTTGGGCTWIIEGGKYNFAPLFIQGSKFYVNVTKPNHLKIGCQQHSFQEWEEKAEEICVESEESYEELKEEYQLYFDLAKMWAKGKGWYND